MTTTGHELFWHIMDSREMGRNHLLFFGLCPHTHTYTHTYTHKQAVKKYNLDGVGGSIEISGGVA